MARTDDIALLLAGLGGTGDIGFHQGVVKSWDSTTNNNTITVAGENLTDIPALSTGDNIMLTAGDPVCLLKIKSAWFVLGRVTVPGASKALRLRAAKVTATSWSTGSSYADLATSSGPSLTDVYIGSSRQCLVIISAAIYADVDNSGAAHFQVSGASTINPPTGPSAFSEGAFIGTFSGGGAIQGTGTKTYLLTAADGLNEGYHTFTMKYLTKTIPSVNDTFFSDRVIVVFPF